MTILLLLIPAALAIGGLGLAAFFWALRNGQFEDPEGNAAAGPAAVEAEHKTGLFRGPAMVEGIDAERAVLADQPRRHLFDELEARPPHQRTVAEHPQVALG